ncbi:uncharacterized protein DNG_07688 [Cephalotrichum gorgonifer]|uniref:RING-type domain-containing protein n=1 Tax=Cephalotrichum gorgonifer TaxID=2041049 RepID=A0AAE8N4M4_9PEZI|nr:uncharacterized protein DNG_07688 [Cephalotrichum gorgonifer]
MSTFYSFLDQISTTAAPTARSSTISSPTHHNPHAMPTPVDVTRLLRLVQEQMETLATTAPSPENRDFLTQLVSALEDDILDPPETVHGVGQEFLDGLERVNRKKLGEDESCPICAERFLDDKYCLVVELPCHKSHKFDLECVGPWLQSKGCCPFCRADFTKKKEVVVVEDDEEDDDPMGMFS